MIKLPSRASLRDYQTYIRQLEALHGWLDVDLVHNCFLMGEEVGELFKAIRRFRGLFIADQQPETDAEEGGQCAPGAMDLGAGKAEVAEELVDVFNYLLAIANRLEIDLEHAFREKNARNQQRTWT